ncbi:MAG TPA: filamentous hemagglutinin N-terminal domain-containing protein [Rhabdochlamydiaceae bacterium]|jgi:filamentous hemagglutinin family protein|nr:filamentous hemagglutinin N-terminal domain-containing protein [Rhabdochlamydiaceae bacterium]
MLKILGTFSLCLLSLQLEADLQLESIAHGNVDIQTQGKETLIQASDQSILNFHKYDIAKDESVYYRMNDPSHRILNRIHSDAPSHIEGKLGSNGIVYLINPAGVVFGPESIVNVASLIVAAAHLSNEDFLKRHDHFYGIKGAVETAGHLSAGNIVLIGSKVLKGGEISAKQVVYSVGDQLYLGKEGEHLFIKCHKDRISEENSSTFLACGSAESFFIHHGGTTKADSIAFYGEKGSQLQVTGDLDASCREQELAGGSITLQGEKIELRSAKFDVSGRAGGGTIYVGGGRDGKGLSPTAREVDCDSETTLLADALVQGNGGTIVQWADEYSKADGFYSARGGPLGGEGGMIETSSGRGGQSLTTRVDVDAPKGKPGSWKTDPYSIQIVDSGGSATLADLNDGSNNSYVINSSVINAATAGSTVIFAANNSTGHAPGSCTIALGTPSTPAHINTTNANVTLIFNTTESPTVRGMMTMNGTIQSATSVFSTPVTLTGNTSVTASNATTFNFDVNGDGNGFWDFSLSGNSVICQGSIGNTNPVGAFSVTTPSNNGGFLVGNASPLQPSIIQAHGAVMIGAFVAPQASFSITSTTGGITFNNYITARTPTSQENMTLSAQGDITFKGTLGSNTLGDILIQTANTVHLQVSPLPLSSGIPPPFIQCRSFTQLSGTGDTKFEGSLLTTGVPTITRNPPQNGGAVYINTAGDINFYYLVNTGGFPDPVLTYTLPTRTYYKSVINTTGARVTAPGSGFNGGDVTLLGRSVNLLGVYAGGTFAFPGSSFPGGKGGNVTIETTMGLSLRGPIFATGGPGAGGGGQVLPTLIFSGQNLNTAGTDSPGNILITGPISIGFNGVVLRGQNIEAPAITGENLNLLAVDGATNGAVNIESLSNLSYFVVDDAKGVKVMGPVQAEGVTLFNSGTDGVVFEDVVTATNITAISDHFCVTFEKEYVAAEVRLLNCGCSPTPPNPPNPSSPTGGSGGTRSLAGVYAPSLSMIGNLFFDTSFSLFSILNARNPSAPFADVFNMPVFQLNYLFPPESVPELTESNLEP